MNVEEYTRWEKLDSPGFTLSNSLWALVPLEAWRRGLEVHLMPGARYKISDPTRTYSFRQTRLSGGEWETRARNSDDKQLTRETFLKEGLPAPVGELFDADAPETEFLEYANLIGYPVCVKPNNLSKGLGVFPENNNDDEVIKAVNAIRGLGTQSQIIVESHVPGKDIRVLVVGRKVVAASLRTAAYVSGDGNSTIRQLVDFKNLQRSANPHLSLNLVQKDAVAETYLQAQGFEWNTVLAKGQRASLSGPANISAGGDSIDITDNISDQVKSISINAVRTMGLHHGGVDLLLDDYSSEDASIFINELNPSSGLGPHIYPGIGNSRDVPAAIIDYYFPGSQAVKGSHNWAFALNDVSRILRDKVAESVLLTPLQVPREPAWRRYILEHDVDSLATLKSASLGILRKREVSGLFRRVEADRSYVVFSGELSRVELVERSLKNLAVRTNSRLKLASRSAFVTTVGVRSS